MGLAFFDDSITSEMKIAMVDGLQLDCDEYDDEDEIVAQNSHRVIAKTDEIMRSYLTKKFSDFVTKNTLNFFERFSIPVDFLRQPPQTWSASDSYKKGLVIINQIKVTNDTAERSVQSMAGFIGIITKDDKRYRELVTVVDDYNKSCPSYAKKDLV